MKKDNSVELKNAAMLEERGFDTNGLKKLFDYIGDSDSDGITIKFDDTDNIDSIRTPVGFNMTMGVENTVSIINTMPKEVKYGIDRYISSVKNINRRYPTGEGDSDFIYDKVKDSMINLLESNISTDIISIISFSLEKIMNNQPEHLKEIKLIIANKLHYLARSVRAYDISDILRNVKRDLGHIVAIQTCVNYVMNSIIDLKSVVIFSCPNIPTENILLIFNILMLEIETPLRAYISLIIDIIKENELSDLILS